MKDIFLVKKPWITEKSADLSSIGKYVFMVKPSATKPEIKKAIKDLYKVDPVSVNIIVRPAKKKKIGYLKGNQPKYKKAVVTLKEGQKIEIQ
ncbi:MAG: 50S ribosomal protein L23 [Patescibacteria group bacterium]